MAEENKKEEMVKVEDKKKPDKKAIFLSNPLNVTNEDNELILGDDSKPIPKMIKGDDGRETQEIEKVSLGVKFDFIRWLDVQKWVAGDLEISRGDLLKKMIYEHPKLGINCQDDGRSLSQGLFCSAKSYRETPGQTVEKAFKGYKTFDYEAFDKGMAELIKKCSGEG